MSALSLTPALHDHAYDGQCPSFPRLWIPSLTGDSRLTGLVDRFRRKHGMVGGIIPREDVFVIDMDVEGYKPEDLTLSIQGDILTISGTHEKKNEDGTHRKFRHFTRSFIIPDNLELDKIKSCVSKDGPVSCLRVEAPLKYPATDDEEKAKLICGFHPSHTWVSCSDK